MLLAYEEAYNALIADELQPHERDALYTLHTMLRTRASGSDTQKESAGDEVTQRS